MSRLLFDSDNIEMIQSEQFIPNVLNKFKDSSQSFKSSNAFSDLKSCGRCGISGFISDMNRRISNISNNLNKIDAFLDSSIGNYRSLESRILEKGGSFQMDSEALSSSLSSLFEISKFVREYRSDDSNSYLEFNPVFSNPSSSSIVSSSQGHSIYGNSVSKYATINDENYTVSSVYEYKHDDESSEGESITVEEFINKFDLTDATSIINSSTSTSYQQGESTNS